MATIGRYMAQLRGPQPLPPPTKAPTVWKPFYYNPWPGTSWVPGSGGAPAWQPLPPPPVRRPPARKQPAKQPARPPPAKQPAKQQPAAKPPPAKPPPAKPPTAKPPTAKPPTAKPPTAAKPAAAVQPKTEWQTAAATWFVSYPKCCSDPSADQTECKQNNGCAYQGAFMGVDGRKPRQWVEDNNIAAVFQPPNRQNLDGWRNKWKGKRLEIKRPGKNLIVTALDTCNDSDCNGCCTSNASKGGGTLIDLEINTAMRFWDKTNEEDVPGFKTIQWRIVG
jgi:hypothetical protein